MPYYVASTGSNTSPYDTWEKAATTLKIAMEAAPAGSTIYCDSTMVNSYGANTTITGLGTSSNPQIIISVDKAANDAYTAGFYVTTSSSFTLTLNGSFFMRGVGLNIGSGSGTSSLTLASALNSRQIYDTCSFFTLGSNTASRINVGSTSTSQSSSVLFRDCYFASTSTGAHIRCSQGQVEFLGGSINHPGTVGQIQNQSGLPSDVYLEGVDFSSCSASVNLSDFSSGSNGKLRFVNCRLPTSWVGGLTASYPTAPSMLVSMRDCDSSNTSNFRMQTASRVGNVFSETTLVRAGGATDGTTPYSWKMVGLANSSWPYTRLLSPSLVWFRDGLYSGPRKVIVEILSGAVLTNRDIQLEVAVPLSNNSSNVFLQSNGPSTVMEASTTHPFSGVSWVTEGINTPIRQRLIVPIDNLGSNRTPIQARVVLSKYATVYVCPRLEIR